mgnify:CR=1 FL=1
MKINKITTGFVIQTFDTEKNEWVSQEFVAGDTVDYETEHGEVIDSGHSFFENEPYLPFDMVKPDSTFSK